MSSFLGRGSKHSRDTSPGGGGDGSSERGDSGSERGGGGSSNLSNFSMDNSSSGVTPAFVRSSVTSNSERGFALSTMTSTTAYGEVKLGPRKRVSVRLEIIIFDNLKFLNTIFLKNLH